MNPNAFDSVALIRAILIGLCGGLFTAAIVAFVDRKTPRRNSWILTGLTVALTVSVIVFFTWPELVSVPDLGNLSQAEAETLLQKNDLVPLAMPQHGTQTQAGRVIPFTQDPASGIRVRRMTAVRFGVAADSPLPPTNDNSAATVTFFQPKSMATAKCKLGGDGIHRFPVSGTSTGLSNRLALLLWIKPVKPPSERPGWYLQRLPGNGITSLLPDGRWEGIAQVGNTVWPPHAGDVLDVAVAVIDSASATRLLNEPGVVTRVSLPGVAADVASGVRVELR